MIPSLRQIQMMWKSDDVKIKVSEASKMHTHLFTMARATADEKQHLYHSGIPVTFQLTDARISRIFSIASYR